MTEKELVLSVLEQQGKENASDLRARAPEMDGTGIIAEEEKIPWFDPEKNYTGWKTGSPVKQTVNGETQVFVLNIPHNAAEYPGVTPENNRTLWGISHTKDPAKAKPFVPPSGTSGLYKLDEVCTDPDAEDPAVVYRNLKDDNEFPPHVMPSYWEVAE